MDNTFKDQSTAIPADHIRRLAFVNGWSDELVAHAQDHLQGSPDEGLEAMQRAADDLNLSVLRGGDETLAQRAAATLGFASLADLRHFQRENPLLSAALKAKPALDGGCGRVVGVSSTEVVFATEHGPLFFERACLKADVGVGDAVRVGKFGDAEVMPGAPTSVYEPGTKYNGTIPEIKFLPVTAIHRQEMDFRPEVMTISDEEAEKMLFSEPVEVTAFRYGPANHDMLPEVTLRDGYHRTAAAIQTHRPHLPVEVKAVNAKGEKLNALIAMSQVIEVSLKAKEKWEGGRKAKTLSEAKELAELVMTRLGLPLPLSWRESKGSVSPWEFAELDLGSHKTLTVGASSGGVVSINRDPFTPVERGMNITLANVERSMSDAVARLRQGPTEVRACMTVAERVLRRLMPTGQDSALFDEIALNLDHPESMSKDVFLKLADLEQLDLNAAASGQDCTEGFDEVAQEIERLLDSAPWTLHPDHGCIRKDDLDQIESSPAPSFRM